MIKTLIQWIACLGIFSTLASENTLVVGTNATFPPFCYIEENEIVGFDIDIAHEVARRLGKTIQFKDMPFDALIPGIALGQVDLVAAGMSYTEERAKRALFTKAYLADDPLVVFTTAEKKMSGEDFQGKTIVVVEGFTADLFMSNKKGVNLVRLPFHTDGFLAVKNHRADAFVTAKSTVDVFFEKQDASQFHVTPIEGTKETCALVVPKNKPQMLSDVQRALDEMERDGTMAELKTKWKLQ